MRGYAREHTHRLMFVMVVAITFLFSVHLQPAAAAPEEGRAAAEKEGKVVFYTSIAAADGPVFVEHFQKKYPGIKVDLIRLNNTGILSRVLAEQRANKTTADVVDLKGDVVHQMKKMGLLARYLSPERKAFADRFKDKDGYWNDVYLTVHSVVYNTRLVAPQDVPTTYKDLLKPRWKGKIGLNPDNYMWPEGLMKVMGKEEGLKYLEALAQQNPLVREGGTLNVMMAAAGEVAIALPINNNNIESVKAKGAPVEWAKIKPYYGDLHPIALVANAPHPNAAKLFIDYMLSQEGQELVLELGKIAPRSGLKTKTVKPEEITPVDPTIDKAEYYQKLLKQTFAKKK